MFLKRMKDITVKDISENSVYGELQSIRYKIQTKENTLYKAKNIIVPRFSYATEQVMALQKKVVPFCEEEVRKWEGEFLDPNK